MDSEAVHVTKVRCWRVGNFPTDYVTEQGKQALAVAIKQEKSKLDAANKAKAKATPVKKRGKDAPGRGRGRGGVKATPRTREVKRPRKGEVIELDSEESKEEAEAADAGVPDRGRLRDLFNRAKERMTGRGEKRRAEEEEGALAGGSGPKRRGSVQEEKKLVSGTSLRPGVMTPLAIEDRVVTRDGCTTSSMKKKRSKGTKDAGELLLEQAAQVEETRSSRKKKKSKGEGKIAELLRKAVGGKKKKKKKKKGKRRYVGKGIKKEPGDPDDSDGDDSDSSDSSESSSSGEDEESKSDLSYEPPLRKKALTSPGSVTEDLIQHAQEQMDRGAMLDQDGRKAGLVQGIKLSTYFALLIRPY